MGRVSKYKKSKKFDLFNSKADVDLNFDRPPDEHDRQGKSVGPLLERWTVLLVFVFV